MLLSVSSRAALASAAALALVACAAPREDRTNVDTSADLTQHLGTVCKAVPSPDGRYVTLVRCHDAESVSSVATRPLRVERLTIATGAIDTIASYELTDRLRHIDVAGDTVAVAVEHGEHSGGAWLASGGMTIESVDASLTRSSRVEREGPLSVFALTEDGKHLVIRRDGGPDVEVLPTDGSTAPTSYAAPSALAGTPRVRGNVMVFRSRDGAAIELATLDLDGAAGSRVPPVRRVFADAVDERTFDGTTVLVTREAFASSLGAKQRVLTAYDVRTGEEIVVDKADGVIAVQAVGARVFYVAVRRAATTGQREDAYALRYWPRNGSAPPRTLLESTEGGVPKLLASGDEAPLVVATMGRRNSSFEWKDDVATIAVETGATAWHGEMTSLGARGDSVLFERKASSYVVLSLGTGKITPLPASTPWADALVLPDGSAFTLAACGDGVQGARPTWFREGTQSFGACDPGLALLGAPPGTVPARLGEWRPWVTFIPKSPALVISPSRAFPRAWWLLKP